MGSCSSVGVDKWLSFMGHMFVIDGEVGQWGHLRLNQFIFSGEHLILSPVELSFTCVCFQVTKQRIQSLQVTLKSTSFALYP